MDYSDAARRNRLNSLAYNHVLDGDDPQYPDNVEYMALFAYWKRLLPQDFNY